jgi:murein L,D-transpeptidase YcbB/YkuD
VSSRSDGEGRRQAPEDDWFATPDDWFSAGSQEGQAEPAELLWDDGEDELEPAPGPPGLGQRQLIVVAAVVGIIVVIVVAILVVRLIGGSSGTTSTPVATTPVTTTPVDTTPVTTASTTTTPTTTSTTPTTTGTTTTGTTTTPTVGSVPTGQTLKAGLTGSSVLALQQALVQLGYHPGTPDGNFGAGTSQAVIAFQKDNNLPQDGLAGAKTLEAINAALVRG